MVIDPITKLSGPHVPINLSPRDVDEFTQLSRLSTAMSNFIGLSPGAFDNPERNAKWIGRMAPGNIVDAKHAR